MAKAATPRVKQKNVMSCHISPRKVKSALPTPRKCKLTQEVVMKLLEDKRRQAQHEVTNTNLKAMMTRG